MALKFSKNHFSIYAIILILLFIIYFLFQSTFINFFNEKEIYESSKIQSNIDISRSKFGFTKIQCKSVNDYYFASGFMQSYDRFIQIETLRRIGKGELSSFLKQDLTVYDKILKDLNLIDIAYLTKNDPINKNYNIILQKYVDGINFFINKYKDKLPLEFGLINYDVDIYTLEDIYLISEVYKLMNNNTLKVDLFSIINIIQFGKTKANKLFEMLNIKVSEEMLNNISTKKYTYGELNYLKKIYEFIEFINYGKPTAFDSPYYINSDGEKLISYNHYSKTFINFGPYYQESFISNDTLSALYNVGSPIPLISRKNQIVYLEANNNKDNFSIELYDISENKLKYKSLLDSVYQNFNIGIDSIKFNKKIKLEYNYKTKFSKKIINYDNDNFTLGLSIDLDNHLNNNKLDYVHNMILNDSLIDYNSTNFKYLYLNNNLNTVVEQGYYSKILDTLNVFDEEVFYANNLEKVDNYYYNNIYDKSVHNRRLKELISDDHIFTLTDLRLINNDNKNIFAEEYLPKYLKYINVSKSNNSVKKIFKKLSKWDYIDNIKSIESIIFKDITDNIIKEYLESNYKIDVFRYLEENVHFKNIIIENIFSKINADSLAIYVRKSWNKSLINRLYKNKNEKLNEKSGLKVNHFLTYYNNSKIMSLPIENYKASENCIKFFHNFENSLITNNASLIFNLNLNKNYLIMNFGESARLESIWNKNLFEIWKTGGLVESKLEFEGNEKIIEIKKK